MRMQIPIHVGEANVLFYNTAYGALREAAAGIVPKNRFAMGRTVTPAAGAALQEQLLAHRPVRFERLLRFSAVWHDAFLISFAADAQHFLLAIHIGKIQSGEFAYAKAGGVEQFQQRAIALQQ